MIKVTKVSLDQKVIEVSMDPVEKLVLLVKKVIKVNTEKLVLVVKKARKVIKVIKA